MKFLLDKHRYTAMALLSALILVGSGISLGIGFSNRGVESVKIAEEPDIGDGKEAGTVADPGQILEGKININAASADEFDLLPGIGPAYAQRIVDYRNANGPFKSASEIQNIAGIGPKTFEKIMDLITVE